MLSELVKKKMYEDHIQSMEFKKEIGSVFLDGRMQPLSDVDKTVLYKSWEPIRGVKTESAIFYANGKHFSEFLCDEDKNLFEALSRKKEAFIKSFIISKLDITKADITDLMPQSFLSKLFSLKNKATDKVFAELERPKNYEFLEEGYDFIKQISGRKLNLSRNDTFKDNPRYKTIFGEGHTSDRICYDMFKTVTGRLSIEPKTFPILNLDKDMRGIIMPTNNVFVELDYNSAEIRILNSLSGAGVEADDVHAWMAKNVFDIEDRGEAKKMFFAWLYNPIKRNEKLDSLYKRQELLEKYYKNGTIFTPFNRAIGCDEYHAINYLLQSTSSDLTMSSAIKISKILKGKRSFVAFTMHDGVILDMSNEDFHMLKDLKAEYENTSLGFMKANVSVGSSYGNMRLSI